MVHIQRLLREPPHASIGGILDKDVEPLPPDATLGQVARMLATYDLVGAAGRRRRGPPARGGHRRRRARPHPPRGLARGAARRGDPRGAAPWLSSAGSASTSPARAAAAASAAPPMFTRRPSASCSEKFARYMGTPYFLIGMTVFVLLWVGGTSWRPGPAVRPVPVHLPDPDPQPAGVVRRSADPARAEPPGRPRPGGAGAGPRRDERNLADTEFLTREVAALRIALRDQATRDFVRGELRDLLDELEERGWCSCRARSSRRPDDGLGRARAARPRTRAPAPT